jgi:hypothetical protein
MTVISDSQPTPYRQGTLPIRKAITDPDLARYPELEELVGYGYQITANLLQSNNPAGSPSVGSKRRKSMDSFLHTPSVSTPKNFGADIQSTLSTRKLAMTNQTHELKRPELFATPTRSRPNPRLHPEGRSCSANDQQGVEEIREKRGPSPHGSAIHGGLGQRPQKRRRHTADESLSSVAPSLMADLPLLLESHSENHGMERTTTGTNSAQRHAFSPPGVIEGHVGLPDEDSECDYESWEAGHSVEGLRELREEMQRGSLQSSSLGILANTDPSDQDGGQEASLKDTLLGKPGHSSNQGDSPTVSDLLLGAKSKPRDRSMTEPAFEQNPASPSNPFSHPSPARLRRAKTTSEAQLTALESVYDLVSDAAKLDGISQIPVAELLKAKVIANRIGEVLDEQVYSKLGKGQRGRDDEQV